MSGAGHELVQGDDCPPLIGVEPTPSGFRFRVTDFHGKIIGSLWFATRGDAEQAEEVFRQTVARAPNGQVREVIRDWFDRQADLPDWSDEESTTERR